MTANRTSSRRFQSKKPFALQCLLSFAALSFAFLFFTAIGQAKYIGGEPPTICGPCKCKCGDQRMAPCPATCIDSPISYSEGNATEQYDTASLNSTSGPTVNLSLTYGSYNADGSRAQIDTVLGYGWTHSYNIYLFNQLGNMFRMDGMGRVTKYQYASGGFFVSTAGYFETLVNNLNGTFTLKQKDGTTYLFALIPNTSFFVEGPVYRLSTIKDRNNNLTSLTYDGGGNLTRVTDTYGRVLTFTYNLQKHLSAVTDPLGRTTTFTYDSTGRRLAQITDPQGKVTQYTYNVLSQMTQKVDRDGRVFTYSYTQLEPTGVADGANSNIFGLANPINWATDDTILAQTQLRVYIPSTTSKTDGRGNVWNYQYDSRGYITSIVAPDGATATYTYDLLTSKLASQTDANGHTTSYQYDAMGNMIRRTDALGFVTTYAYEPVFNQMTSMTDPNGRTTTYTYDAHGNRSSETDPLGGSRSWTYDSHGNVTAETDKNGHASHYTYDAFGNRVQSIDALGNITTMTYDAVGNVLSRTDPKGHVTTYMYDSLNRLIKETDPLGNSTTTVYDGQGNRIKVTDRNGNATQYQYDQRGRLIKVTDPLSQTTTSLYDGNNNMVSSTDKNGHTASYTYDTQDRRIKIMDALGNTTSSIYDAAGNTLKVTDANGNATNYIYDALNRIVTTNDPVGGITSTVYDSTGPCAGCTGPTKGSSLASKRTDGNGKVTYYKHDGLDRLIRQVRKQGGTADTETSSDAVTVTTYDAVGNRLSTTEPNGNTTTYTYDALNRQISVINPAGDQTITSYDGVGNVISTTEPTGNVTTYTYDALNRPIQVQDDGGIISTTTYDAVGNRLSRSDGNGNTTSTTYDAINRVTQTTDPLGQTTQYVYDPVGNLLSSTDRNSNATSYFYDAINRRTRATDALGNTTQYQYDPVGNLIKITDANGNATTYTYDAANRMVRETYADGMLRTYAYDFAGNLTSRTDQNGQTTTYSYSDLYYLLKRTYPFSPADNMTYDLSGRMLSAQRGGWPVTFSYDAANRLVQTVQNGQTITYSYNIPGRTRAIAYPGGHTITESMDLRSRLMKIDDLSSPSIVQYTYDAANRVIQRSYRNGTSAPYSYNNNNWVTNLQHSFGITSVAGFAYAYDNEGNKIYEQKLHDLTHSEAYTYDSTYRLIEYKVGTLVGSTVLVPSTQNQYSLDPVGNWTNKVKDGIPEARTHNAVNEITSINGGPPLAYDNNGNLTKDSLYSYSYDEENRLTAVMRNSDSAVVGQYQYDALSRRVRKDSNPAGSPATTRYFYDGARVIEEQDGGGITQATYVYGNYVDEVLTMDRSAQTYYYHQNALWSVEAITNSAATVVERYSYDAYGQPSVTDGLGVAVPANAWGTPHSAIGNPYLFTGRQLDEETGLDYYRARYYDTEKGRFLQRDPAEYVEGLNLYEYSRSNPLKFFDPSGAVTGSFAGGEERSAAGVAAGIRGTTFPSYKVECKCSDCSREEKKPCWRMACEFNVSAPIRIRPDADEIWKSDAWDSRYGNTDGTVASRVANTRAHERDHQRTTQAFYDYNRPKLESEEKTCHETEAKCNERKNLVEDRVKANWALQDRHSDTFDNIPARRVGNQYDSHPLTGQSWPE